MISGIYTITNNTNGKQYIGSSKDIKTRFTSHRSLLNCNKHGNQHLQNAWNKYGKDNFKFEIQEICLIDNLKSIETYWLKWIKLAPNLFYNIGESAYSWNRGKTGIYSDKTLHKMSLSAKGRKHSDEFKLKLSLLQKGQIPWNRNKIIHIFKNKTTNETFEGTQYDFYKKYNLCQSDVYLLVKGSRKSVKGWNYVNRK